MTLHSSANNLWLIGSLNDFQHGSRESIETVLPTDPAQRVEYLKAFVSADIQSKLSAGEKIDSAGYLQSWPEVDAAWLTQLVANAEGTNLPKQLTPAVQVANTGAESSKILLKPSQWQPGETIGQFKIVSKIGEGSHGLVFLADDILLNRRGGDQSFA